MSRLRANQITNENANGAPNFPHGLTVTGIVTATTTSTTLPQIVVGSAVTANSQGIDVTGIVTATSFKGDGSNLTGIDASSIKNGSDVKVQANASGAVVTGILTSPTVVQNKILPIGGIESAGTNIYTGGGIVQIKQFVYKTATSISVSGGNMYDSGVECTITPHSSSNQIFVVVDMCVGLTGGYGGRLILRRDSTDLINFRGTPSGTRPIVTKGFTDHKGGSVGNDSYSFYNVPIHALDQPNTTSAVTYKVRIGSYAGNNVFINRTSVHQDGGGGNSDGLGSGSNAYDAISVSTMTLMEVSS
jgi:hypothetical protein|tara:strand:- start:3987 stop:4895 length:909 start_codon:yes stop_codon:yes gene_type:complete